jgi:predicted transcriptional regulator
MGNTWEDAILRCINDIGGTATNRQMYKEIGNYRILTERNKEISRHQGRPNYMNAMRSHFSDLVGSGELIREREGCYSITKKGLTRIGL